MIALCKQKSNRVNFESTTLYILRRGGGCAEETDGDADHEFCSSNSAKLKCGDNARAQETNPIENVPA